MNRKLRLCIYILLLFAVIIAYLALGKFVFVDCDFIINNGYTQEIGFGMSLILFYVIGFFLPGCILEFVKFCKSSGPPVDK